MEEYPINISRNATASDIFNCLWIQNKYMIDAINEREQEFGVKPVTFAEFSQYLRQHFYMGMYHLPELREYWSHGKGFQVHNYFAESKHN